MVLKNPNLPLHTKQVGLKAEMHCATYFVDRGYGVSLPFGDDLRYDLVVDYKNVLFRVQVKAASVINDNIISFDCRSCSINMKGCKNIKYTPNEIDCFATFWNGQCYIVPVQEASATKNLHLGIPKNGQKKGINFAADYIAEKQLESMYLKQTAKLAVCFLVERFLLLQNST